MLRGIAWSECGLLQTATHAAGGGAFPQVPSSKIQFFRHLGTAGAVRCGAVRSSDQDDRRVGLSPGARNTIRDSRFDVKSCIRHAAPTGGWITRGEVLICTTDE